MWWLTVMQVDLDAAVFVQPMTFYSCKIVRDITSSQSNSGLFLILSVLKNEHRTDLNPLELVHLARTCVRGATTTVCRLTWIWQSSKTKMERDLSPDYEEGYFANTLWVFLHFDVTLLCSVSLCIVWNVNVNFCVHINECLLTEKIFIYFDLLQLICFIV